MFNFDNIHSKKGYKVVNNVYFFQETPTLDSNNYIISNGNKDDLTLIDAGNGISLNSLIENMNKLSLSYTDIRKIVLTHIHVDHLLGIYPLLIKLKDKSPEVYAFGPAAKAIKNADINSIFPGNLGIGPGMFKVEIVPVEVNELYNGQILQIGDYNFKIIHTPGHSEGSICLYDSDSKILICGDLIFPGGSFGRFDFPGGSLEKLKRSIKLVNELDVKYLLPGHMNYSDNGNKEIEHSLYVIENLGSFFF